MEFSAISKILLVFLAVLAANRLRLPLGLALVGGGVFLELWTGRSLATVSHDLGLSLLRPELWLLVINITLIMEVGHFMAAGPNARAIISAARRWGGRHGYAASLILIPAVLGLVPMPGGALFSAPLIGRTVENSRQTPAWKAAVNYWFRHVLEYWWPLYPVVIVTLSIFSIETWKFMAIQSPFTLVSVAAGYFFLLRNHLHKLPPPETGSENTSSLSHVLLPIFLIVACTLLLPGVFRHFLPRASSTVAELLAMLAGLAGGLLLVARDQRRPGAAVLFKNLFTGQSLNVLFTLGGVMIFQSLLSASELLPIAGRELTNGRVPLALVIALLPFIAGLVTGIAIGFAGTAFPIIVGFIGLEGAGLPTLSTLVLAFSMGYAGMMLSPVHLCLLLTRDYFAAPFLGLYRYLLPCVLSVMAAGVGLHFLLGAIGW